MSVHIPLPISIVQMGHVEKLAEVAQNQTSVQQQVTQEETIRKMQEKNVDPTLPATQAKVGDEEKKQHHAPRDNMGSDDKRHAASDEASEPKDPFTGIIVNIKV